MVLKSPKIRPPLHVSLNNSVAKPLRFLKDGLVTELLRKTCKGGMILAYILKATSTLNLRLGRMCSDSAF